MQFILVLGYVMENTTNFWFEIFFFSTKTFLIWINLGLIALSKLELNIVLFGKL